MTRGSRMGNYRLRLYCVFLGLLAGGVAFTSAKPQTKVAGEVGAAVHTLPPDLLVINGKILTVDAKDSVVEAVAIAGGKIVAVGSSAEIAKLESSKTRIIDLHGRTATPGLIDSHGHFADGGVGDLYNVNLSDAASVSEIVRRVGERAAALKPGEWVLGIGWDEGKLAELRYVYASDLDRVTPKNPVWLMHTTGHYGAANSYALKLAHVTTQTKDPPTGTIDRDSHGVPTGVLKESAMDLVDKLVPPTSPEQERKAILHMTDEMHREGMTAVKEADIQAHTWDAYRQVLDDGKLTVRVFTL